ncbi:MAG: bifunctional UDP-sugar hydrolase/5'-nucleotidase, partial [Bacteroidales bacterium]
ALVLNAQESRRLTILHTNDFHSHLQGYGPESAYTPLVIDGDPTVGGFSRIAGVISETKSANPNSTLVLDAGDCLMGTLFQALEPSTGFQLNLMKLAGYDVVALGNHDFDFGPQKYAEIVRNAAKKGALPIMLAGNAVTDPENNADDEFEAVMKDGLIKRYQILEREGLKIGIFSLLGKDADESAPYAPPVTFEKIVPAARNLVKELKSKGCDVIICLSHSGIAKDKKGAWSGEDVELAQKVKGIDIIISGHTHILLNEPLIVNETPILSAGDNGRFVGKAEITISNNGVKLDKYQIIKIDDKVTADPEIQSSIETDKLAVDREILKPLGLSYDMPVATAPYTMFFDEFGDLAASNLGALVADAIYDYMNNEGPGTDIAMVAEGVLRDPIQPGVQSVADIFRVMSLGSGTDNVPGYALSKLWCTGKELKNIAEILIFLSGSTPSNFPYYSHLRIEYDPEGGIFNKVRRIELTGPEDNVTEVNTSKKSTKLYSVVANSYLVDNLPLIKKKTFGLISVVPKDSDGIPVTDFGKAVVDFNTSVPGLQEGKEWIALLKYLQQFTQAEGGGLPVIPQYYRNPSRSLVTVSSEK